MFKQSALGILQHWLHICVSLFNNHLTLDVKDTVMFSPSVGKWVSPPVSGERPPPCAGFSLTMIDPRRAVLFGGREEKGKSNDVYILDLQSMVCIC